VSALCWDRNAGRRGDILLAVSVGLGRSLARASGSRGRLSGYPRSARIATAFRMSVRASPVTFRARSVRTVISAAASPA
jgi:hypothetical protein